MLVPRSLLAAALLAAVGLGVYALTDRHPEAPAPGTGARDATPAAPSEPTARTAAVDTAVQGPVAAPAREPRIPANARHHDSIPDNWRRGIQCPDGSFLPLLNGVPWAKPLSRSIEAGPLPPVVEVVEDIGGDQWYRHADGSFTTCRWMPISFQSGDGLVEVMDVVTTHMEMVPGEPIDGLRGQPDENGDVPIGGGPRQTPPGGGSQPPVVR
ncbi:MAG: hypothetical protein IPM29_05600 [Planctomycetes bacterium]|nr:hypothetical protein [Planctomycetota bacterium]